MTMQHSIVIVPEIPVEGKPVLNPMYRDLCEAAVRESAAVEAPPGIRKGNGHFADHAGYRQVNPGIPTTFSAQFQKIEARKRMGHK